MGASLGNVFIKANEAICLTYTIYLPIYHFVELEYASLFGSTKALRNEKKMTWRDTFDFASNHARIHIISKETLLMASLKRDLNKLFLGYVVVDRNGIVWHPFFASLSGLNYLKELGEKLKCIVHRDAERSRIRLFGSRSIKNKCQEQIMSKISQLKNSVIQFQVIKLRSDSMPNTKNTTISGNAVEANKKQHEEICPACFCSAENPFRAQCGDVYCIECLIHQCKAAGDGSFPIVCVGKGETCSQPLPFEDLSRILNHELLDKLLALSAAAFMRSNLTTYRYCPNSSCGSIYKIPNQAGTVLTCCDCFTSICTSCYDTTHRDLTCEEYRSKCDGGFEAFQEWKEKEGVKDCPKCGIAIEKIEGCNHVQCTTCKTHLCYYCLAAFKDPDECYAHMETEGHTDEYGDEDDDFTDYVDEFEDELDMIAARERAQGPQELLIDIQEDLIDLSEEPDSTLLEGLDWAVNLDARDMRGMNWVEDTDRDMLEAFDP